MNYKLAAAVLALVFVSAMPAHAINVEIVHSPGGIEAWLVHEKTVPIIAMQFAFKGSGTVQDASDKQGLTTLMASLLDEGAGPYDSQSFAEKLKAKAIYLSFSASRDNIGGSLSTLSMNRDEAFGMLHLALASPRFDDEAIERIRNLIFAQLRRQKTDIPTLADQAFWAAGFPDHPYSLRPLGSEEMVKSVTRNDILDEYKHLIAKENLKVSVVGDIEAAELAKALDTIFADLPAKAQLRDIPETMLQGGGKQIVVQQEGPQSSIKFGNIGIKRRDPDYMAGSFLNEMLGNTPFASRLFLEVREKKGLTYHIETDLLFLEHCGIFSVSLATRNEKAGEAVQTIKDVIAQFLKEGPTDKEIEDAKSHLIGSYPLSFDTSSKIAGMLLSYQLDGFTPDYLTEREKLIRAVTKDDIKRVAKRMLEKPFLVIIAGKPQGLEANP